MTVNWGLAKRIMSGLIFPSRGGGCHGEGAKVESGLRKVVIAGSPNVGKSAVFNGLTGAYAAVSNYPGTTVEIFRGKAKIGAEEFAVMDTPGMYSLLPITGEELVARSILFQDADVIVHVVDARNLERMLPLTLQFIEAGLPVILDLNMVDELEASGMEIDVAHLERELGIPVVATAATNGQGMEELRRRIAEYVSGCREASL